MRVINIYKERLKTTPVVESTAELQQSYGLVSITAPQVGEPLIHVIRSQSTSRKLSGNAVRASLFPCTVEAILPSYVRVRFAAGPVKNVRPDSLFRKQGEE